MGYSCNAWAWEVLDIIQAYIDDNLLPDYPKQVQGAWIWKGRMYFYEIGRENVDGAVTGSVFRIFSKDPRNTHKHTGLRNGDLCERVGSFRIEPYGKVTRFPCLPKEAYAKAEAYLQSSGTSAPV